MMAETNNPVEPTFLRKLVIPLIAGTLTGVLSSVAVLTYMDGELGDALTPSRMIAAVVGALYLMIAIGVGVGAASPALGEKYLNMEDAEEIREQRFSLINSGASMALWGAALIALAIAAPVGPLATEIALGFALVAVGIGTWCGWRSYKASDELLVAVNLEASALSLFAVFVALGGWATAAHLELTTGPKPLDVLTAFYVLSLLMAFVAVGRRGMLKIK